jgi:rhamnosyl/mannosyltransferase
VEEVTIPIDVQRFELNETQLKKVDELRILYPNMVLSIGRLVGYKGFDILIEAAKYVDATICIIGDGPERTRLQADIDRMGLKDRVHLIGSVSNEDVATFLSAAALYALPSSSNAETFGISQLEALAAGLAVINTNLSTAVPHIARHEIEGLTVSPGNAEEFAQAIRTLLSNDSLRKQMEAAARVRAGDFSQDKFSERYHVALIDALKSGT